MPPEDHPSLLAADPSLDAVSAQVTLTVTARRTPTGHHRLVLRITGHGEFVGTLPPVDYAPGPFEGSHAICHAGSKGLGHYLAAALVPAGDDRLEVLRSLVHQLALDAIIGHLEPDRP